MNQHTDDVAQFLYRRNMRDTLQEIINKLWIAPEHSEWTPKTDTVSLNDIRRWFKSDDIEVWGFTDALIHASRFRFEPALTPNEYKSFVTHYYERCLKEDPKGEWADSRYSAGASDLADSLLQRPNVPHQ